MLLINYYNSLLAKGKPPVDRGTPYTYLIQIDLHQLVVVTAIVWYQQLTSTPLSLISNGYRKRERYVDEEMEKYEMRERSKEGSQKQEYAYTV